VYALEGVEEEARRLMREGRARFKALGDEWGASISTHYLGSLAMRNGDFASARELTTEMLVNARATGDLYRAFRTLYQLAEETDINIYMLTKGYINKTNFNVEFIAAPMKPEQACLVLAREAGSKLNTAYVKAFVSAVTFFPVGSLIRTNRDEVGMVVRTNSRDPLHPVITITDDTFEEVRQQVDTSERDGDGRYLRQIVQSIAGQPRSPQLAALLSSAT
jgi:hypothetical protein